MIPAHCGLKWGSFPNPINKLTSNAKINYLRQPITDATKLKEFKHIIYLRFSGWKELKRWRLHIRYPHSRKNGKVEKPKKMKICRLWKRYTTLKLDILTKNTSLNINYITVFSQETHSLCTRRAIKDTLESKKIC